MRDHRTTNWLTLVFVFCLFSLFAIYSFKENLVVAAIYGVGGVLATLLEEIRLAIVRK